jgi:hypothetical protein
MAIQPQYEIRSVDMFSGAPVTHVLAEQVNTPHIELDQVGTFTFSLPVGDETEQFVAPTSGREVQVWRNNVLIWWGPITDRQLASRGRWQIECKTLEWYFTKRVIGKAGRNNYLNNGSWQTGDLTSWSPVGVTANIVTQWGTHPGSYQLNLYQAGAGQDTFAEQIVTVPAGYWTLAAWFQIRTDSQYVGPALDGRGLYVERLNSDGSVADVQFFSITDDTVRGLFQRATTNITVPADNTTLRVRLYATLCTNATPPAGTPPGSIIWAKAQLVLQESRSYPFPSDLADLFNNLTEHAQDPTFNKSSCNIQGVNPSSGLFIDRTYFDSDHEVIFDAFSEWSNNGTCDFMVTWQQSAPYNRYMTMFPRQMGATYNDRTLEIDGKLLQITSTEENGDNVITSAIVTGQGSGPDTDEGGYIDTSLTNGLVLEAVSQAQSNAYYDQLDGEAQEVVINNRAAFIVPVLVVSPTMIGAIGLGDTVRAVCPDINLDTYIRISAIDFDLDKDQFLITCMPTLAQNTNAVTPNNPVEAAMSRFPHAIGAILVPGTLSQVWVVGSDGGVGAYGGAPFLGSMGGHTLNAPVSAIVAHSNAGYWLIGQDGGIFAFGDAPPVATYPPLFAQYAAGDRIIIGANWDGSALTLLGDEGSAYRLSP